jgi:transketolase
VIDEMSAAMTTVDTLEWIPAGEFTRVREALADPADRTRAFATMSRINTLYMIMRAGSGHLGSSFSAADIVSHLYLNELSDPFGGGDVYFSSKGHDVPGLYASLIGLGRLPERMLHRLRRLDGLPGHPDVHTPHMVANTGSLGMGISKAKGMILADRLCGRDRRYFVLTGDGELQEGQNWEALAGADHAAMRELTVIVDHNKIQSDTWVSTVSDLGDLPAKFTAFGWGVLRCDGHDPLQLEAVFRKRFEAYADRPVVIVADTVKGGGCAAFQPEPGTPQLYKFHSGAPVREDYEAAHGQLTATVAQILTRNGVEPLQFQVVEVPAPVPAAGERLVTAYGAALAELASTDERVVALDADLMLDTGLIPFKDAYPDRFIECGIAEQDMVSMAGGLAANGLLPFAHSFSCFLHSRPNEQIFNNGTEGRKVVYVGSLAGLLPAAPGHSHQAVRDVSALAAVPGLVLLEPANAAQTADAVRYCAATPDSVYLRLVSVPVSDRVAALPAGPLTVGCGQTVRVGGRTVAVGAGPVVLGELLAAADLLADEGIDLTVVNLPWWNRVDPAWLAALADSADQLVVVENQFTRGGQADLLARVLLELRLPRTPSLRGIGLTEVPRSGAPAEILDFHGLSAAALAGAIRSTVNGERAEPMVDIAVRRSPTPQLGE